MPVRKIPKNYLGVTGGFSSQKNGVMLGFESLLEKEYMLLLEFDESVSRFEEQPVTVTISGSARIYTPDLLIHFHDSECIRPCLAEIKHTDDLTRNASKYAEKFEAARSYADSHGWEFRIITQQDIRIPKLANLKFLREYRNIDVAESKMATVLDALRQLGSETFFNVLLDVLAPDEEEKLHWLPIIWHLIVTRTIRCDLDVAFTDDIAIWSPELGDE
jgi:hypothetical protein